MPNRPRFQFVVEALPSDVPAAVRLRKLLKAALRAYQLRCVSAEEVPAGATDRAAAERQRAGVTR